MNRIIGLLMAGTFVATTTAAFAATPAPAANSAATAPNQAASTQTPSAPHVGARHASMSRKRVEATQAALNTMGEKVTVDGVWGPKTGSALRDFQQKHSLKPTGRPDAATLQQLKVAQS
jgi:peptidoglycan hydrolase-like protein with peptidoglycan-binding domain